MCLLPRGLVSQGVHIQLAKGMPILESGKSWSCELTREGILSRKEANLLACPSNVSGLTPQVGKKQKGVGC